MDKGNKLKNLVKIARVVPQISSRTDRQTDRQTDRHTHHFATAPAGEVKSYTMYTRNIAYKILMPHLSTECQRCDRMQKNT